MNNERERSQDYGDVENHIVIQASGHQINGKHNGFDLALGLIGALVALVAIVALFVFGLVALPFVAVVAVAWLMREVLG